jgi:hypothetical protein
MRMYLLKPAFESCGFVSDSLRAYSKAQDNANDRKVPRNSRPSVLAYLICSPRNLSSIENVELLNAVPHIAEYAELHAVSEYKKAMLICSKPRK